jgi:RecJ-like exonuclease
MNEDFVKDCGSCGKTGLRKKYERTFECLACKGKGWMNSIDVKEHAKAMNEYYIKEIYIPNIDDNQFLEYERKRQLGKE